VGIRQDVSFTLISESMTPAEITARLMIEPDKDCSDVIANCNARPRDLDYFCGK
jgi:hypothetical protein